MAGRGRGATLPAWMTQQGSAPASNYNDNNNSKNNFDSGNNDNYGSRQFEDAPFNDRNNRNYNGPDNNTRDGRSGAPPQYDDRKRERSRSRDRDAPRGGGGGWQPRTKRSSNFDVAPPEGAVVPPVGIAVVGDTGISNRVMSHSNSFSSGGGGGGGSFSRSGGGGGGGGGGADIQTRHARRIYAGGIPQKATEGEIQKFFNDTVMKALLPKKLDYPPVIKIYLNSEKSYAFVEFDSIEMTTACLQLDGIKFDHPTQLTTIRVRRPNDYRPETLPPSGPIPVLNLSGIAAAAGADLAGSAPANFGPNKIFIGGLPYNLADEQIMELLGAFGPIKNFHQVRDPGSLTSKGYAFCEYFDQAVADAACTGLHGLQLGEKCLSVRIASTGANNASVTGTTAGIAGSGYSSVSSGGGGGGGHSERGHFSNYSGGGAAGGVSGGYGGNDNYGSRSNSNISGGSGGYDSRDYNNYGSGAGTAGSQYNSYTPSAVQGVPQSSGGGGGLGIPSIHNTNPTRVLRLSNMVTPQDLLNDAEVKDIREDVRLECIDHGKVIQVLIPRRKEGYTVEGMIFVEFQSPAMARSAAMVLNGRKFADSTVGVTYYDEARFASGILI